MGRISITYADCDELKMAVEDVTGELTPELHAHRTKRKPHVEVLSYLGANPSIVVFELAVILCRRSANAARLEGYEYGRADVVEELRTLISQIDSPFTEAVGTQLLYFWPTVELRP